MAPTLRLSSSPPTPKSLRLPQIQVALSPISHRQSHLMFAHWPGSRQTSEISSAPSSGLPGRTRVSEPKIAHKHHEGQFFGAQHRNKPPEISVTITLSHVAMYMPCGAAMAPWPPMCCSLFKRGRWKDDTDCSFACGRTVPIVARGRRSLGPSSGCIKKYKKISLFFA